MPALTSFGVTLPTISWPKIAKDCQRLPTIANDWQQFVTISNKWQQLATLGNNWQHLATPVRQHLAPGENVAVGKEVVLIWRSPRANKNLENRVVPVDK